MSEETPRSNKPEVIKGNVIARHLSGESNSKIARDLQISRPTVAVILAESELGSYISEGRQNCLNLIPMAIENVERAIKAGDVKVSVALLKGTGILTDKIIVEDSRPMETTDLPAYFEKPANTLAVN